MSEVYVVGNGVVFLNYEAYANYCKEHNLTNEYEKALKTKANLRIGHKGLCPVLAF
jgi:hypothetical protein